MLWNVHRRLYDFGGMSFLSKYLNYCNTHYIVRHGSLDTAIVQFTLYHNSASIAYNSNHFWAVQQKSQIHFDKKCFLNQQFRNLEAKHATSCFFTLPDPISMCSYFLNYQIIYFSYIDLAGTKHDPLSWTILSLLSLKVASQNYQKQNW